MVGVVSAIMTILILVVSEIIPKTIGATYWKPLADFTAIALKYLNFSIEIYRYFMAFTTNDQTHWWKGSWQRIK